MSNEQPFQTFLDKLASGTPTPGGGGAAAASGAMGAALISMVCNLTIGRKKFAAVEAQMKEILTPEQQKLLQKIRTIREKKNVPTAKPKKP